MSSSLVLSKNDQVQVIYNGVDNAVYPHEIDAGSVRDQFGIAQDALGYRYGWSSECLERSMTFRSCDANLTGPIQKQ